jgi:hypothetical protein
LRPVSGVPGLRVRLHRRHVELYLIDTRDTDQAATVLPANVSYRQWTAALAFLVMPHAGYVSITSSDGPLRTEPPTSECTGSIVQVPATYPGICVAAVIRL